MNDLYEALKTLAQTGGTGVLAEITHTQGSAPRKAGARMLLLPDGSFSGTVGGGSIEYFAQKECLRVLASGEPSEKTYSLGGGPGESIGAICGGSAAVRFTPVGSGEAAALLKEMPAPPRVLLYGAGHVGKALADSLALIGVSVRVTDDREGLLTEERFPHAEREVSPLDNAPMEPAPGDMIVIMTRGHTHDYALLRRAMETDAQYIGVMASRVKAAAFRERLLSEGVTQEELDRRLRCPIGLPIHAETPEEIAVSVTAELIAFIRRGE